MLVKPIKSNVIFKKDNLLQVIEELLKNHDLENSILAITSKVISIVEGRLVPKSDFPEKSELIYREADQYIDQKETSYGHVITIKNNILVPSAGIDESNSEDGSYILYPENPMQSALHLWEEIRKNFHLKNFGILITDSHTTPLRRGVLGVGLAWCGFKPNFSYIGNKDIFGRELQCTTVNVLDALAVAAVFEMGESKEQTPFSLLQNLPDRVVFQSHPPTNEEIESLNISMEEDLYAPLLRSAPWKKHSQ